MRDSMSEPSGVNCAGRQRVSYICQNTRGSKYLAAFVEEGLTELRETSPLVPNPKGSCDGGGRPWLMMLAGDFELLSASLGVWCWGLLIRQR